MLIHQTKEKLAEMKLSGMLSGLAEQLEHDGYKEMSFEERVGLLVDKEYLLRENRRLTRRFREARLKIKAQIEDVDYRAPRGLDRELYLYLAGGSWIAQRHNAIMTGPTGCGKTFLACALAHKACRDGFRCIYYHFPDLLRELSISRAEGTDHSLLRKLGRRDMLVIDDWLWEPVTAEQARAIVELFEHRFRSRSTLLTSQIPVSEWHGRFQDPTLADAVLDRIVHDSYRVELSGDSMRKRTANLTKRNS